MWPSLFSAALKRMPKHERLLHTMKVQKSIEAAYYRGGTSRAVMFQPQNLPKERALWPSIFREIMGSGDPYGRQLDGMGAGTSSLSKICLVERNHSTSVDGRQGAQSKSKVDLDYTFVGLGIEMDEVDVAGNCGNMSSAIGLHAYNAGILPARCYEIGDGQVSVSIRNTNTQKIINSTFEVVEGEAAVTGEYVIDGVAGTGSRIKLDYLSPYGSKTGKVLPTGNRIDKLAGFEVSCIDGANPAVFVRASDVGVDGAILPNDFNKQPEKLELLDRIRRAAAVAMGIVASEDDTPRTVPKIGLVSKPYKHAVLSGQTLEPEQIDILLRFISDGQPHRAIPLTAALTTGVAAKIQGTIVEQLLAPERVEQDAITIGHASGRLQVNATMGEKDETVPISATVYRTAKRLFEGKVFYTGNRGQSLETVSNYGSGGKHSLGMAFVLEHRGQSSSHLFAEGST